MTATTAKRKRTSTSPTKRSMDLMRKEGWLVSKVEHYNSFARQTFDMFGFADLVCLHPEQSRIVAVQTTTQANRAAREAKILANPAAYLWALAGGAVIVHGWRMLSRGMSRPQWVCDVRSITVQDFNSHRAAAEGTT